MVELDKLEDHPNWYTRSEFTIKEENNDNIHTASGYIIQIPSVFNKIQSSFNEGGYFVCNPTGDNNFIDWRNYAKLIPSEGDKWYCGN